MGWRGEQERDEARREDEEEEWRRLPLRERIIARAWQWGVLVFAVLLLGLSIALNFR